MKGIVKPARSVVASLLGRPEGKVSAKPQTVKMGQTAINARAPQKRPLASERIMGNPRPRQLPKKK